MAVKPSKKVKKLVTLDESLLVSMANDKRFTKPFPFLKGLAKLKKARGCGSCGNKNTGDRAEAIMSAKQQIAGMGDDRKRELKGLLNANQVRLTYRRGRKTVQHTF